MSATHTDLVIQISTAGTSMDVPGTEQSSEGSAVAELRRCLQPGAEITLVFRGYMAITSILWLAGPLTDNSLRAGVRLLGVSVLPSPQREYAPLEASQSRTVSLQLVSSAIAPLS